MKLQMTIAGRRRRSFLAAGLLLLFAVSCGGGEKSPPEEENGADRLRGRVESLQAEVSRLKSELAALKGESGPPPKQGLEREGRLLVTRYDLERRDDGIELSGRVQNVGDFETTDIQIVIRTYGPGGAFRDLLSTWGRPARIKPGEFATFYKTLPGKDAVRAELSLRWLVEGREYRSAEADRDEVDLTGTGHVQPATLQ